MDQERFRARVGGPTPARLYLTVPFVVCGVFRYLFLVFGRDQGGNPTEALLGDTPLLVAVAPWAATVVVLIYS